MRSLIATIFIVSASILFAQPWHYDFGTVTGSFSTSSSYEYNFLPPTPAGTDMVYCANSGGGFLLSNQGIAFGSNSYLRLQASSTTSVNKFAVYSIPSASQLFTFQFLIRMGTNTGSAGGTSGKIQLMIGSGSSFSDNSEMNTNESFAALKWQFSAEKLYTSYLSAATWFDDAGQPMMRGDDYVVNIYCNNSSGSLGYNFNASAYTVGSGKYDVWVNNILLYDDVTKGNMAEHTNIDAFSVVAHSSTGNVAYAFLDNIHYSNSIAATPLPVELTSFTASSVNGTVNLNWATASEVSNYGFEVERSADESVWNKIGFVAGNGNSNSVKTYSYSDNTASAGTVYYRLKQLDTDGKYEYSKVVSVNNTTPDAFTVDQNFPNPFNPSTTIRFSLANSSNVKVDVYASNGELVHTLANQTYEAGNHALNFDASQLSAGIYFYRITAIDAAGKSFSAVKKMQLIK